MSRYYQHKNDVREYIVVKHSLRGYEGDLDGVKFRDGYGVVIKDSKQHRFLKSIRPVAAAEEFPLTHLSSLSFIINEKQIEYVWGKSVLASYRQAVKKQETPQSIEFVLADLPTCAHQREDGSACKSKAMKTSQYCRSHVIYDERIADDVKSLGMMPTKLKKEAINKLIQNKIKA